MRHFISTSGFFKKKKFYQQRHQPEFIVRNVENPVYSFRKIALPYMTLEKWKFLVWLQFYFLSLVWPFCHLPLANSVNITRIPAGCSLPPLLRYQCHPAFSSRIFYMYILIKVGASFHAPKKFGRTCVSSRFFPFYPYALLDRIEGNGR